MPWGELIENVAQPPIGVSPGELRLWRQQNEKAGGGSSYSASLGGSSSGGGRRSKGAAAKGGYLKVIVERQI